MRQRAVRRVPAAEPRAAAHLRGHHRALLPRAQAARGGAARELALRRLRPHSRGPPRARADVKQRAGGRGGPAREFEPPRARDLQAGPPRDDAALAGEE